MGRRGIDPEERARARPSESRPSGRLGARASAFLVLVALAGAGTFLALSSCSSGGGSRPSLVVVTVDTLRADRLGCYGYFRPTSAVIDALAEESIVFEDCVTTMATTLPAHVSLWKSRYPIQTGVVTNDLRHNRRPEDPARSLAEILTEAGYETAAFVSAAPVRAVTGVGAGFSVWDEPPDGTPERSADDTTDRVLAWLRERAAGGRGGDPFFLWIHYYDPHAPYDPPAEFQGWPFSHSRQLAYLAEIGVSVEGPKVSMNNDLYDGEVRFTDSQLGRVVDGLRGLGLFDEAAFVLTSDHGEGLGQHGHMGHGWIYNEQLRVPLIVKPPAGRASSLGVPRRRAGRLSLVDVVPTLASLLDLPIPARDRRRFEGIDGMRGSRAWSFAQRTLHPDDRRWGDERQYAVLGPRWKYLYRTQGPAELYDLVGDPHETIDLAAVRTDVVAELEARLLEFVAEHARPDGPSGTGGAGSHDGGDGDGSSRGGGELTDDLREQLRALGYLDE